jgi:hypothetical protein
LCGQQADERSAIVPTQDLPDRPDLDSLRRQLRVVGRAARTDVHRRDAQPLAEQHLLVLLLALPVHARERVELRPVPVRAADPIDRTGVVEERLVVADRRLELELERDVARGVAAVVHVDLVQHVVAELVEVRAAVGLLERDEVRDQRHVLRPVRAHERVDVRAVSDGVLADFRCLAV